LSICKNYIKVAYTITGPKQGLVTRLRCKQWTCDYCAAKNANLWRYWLVKRLPEVASEWWLVTLTAASYERTTLASLKNLRDNVDRLIKRVRRVFGLPIEYVRVYERHPTSEAIHLHMIITGLTPYVCFGVNSKAKELAVGCFNRPARAGVWSVKTWFKKVCQEMGMGYIADVKKLEGTPEEAAWYVCKYLTKDLQSFHVPYLRHVQVTDGIGSPQFEKNYDWVPVSYITARTFDEPNTSVTDIDTGFVIDNNYWEHTGFYPNE